MKNSKGKNRFIVIEGIDGAGTTTQAAAVAEWLRTQSQQVLETMEPSRGPIGKYIRQLLKDDSHPPQLLALAFAADRLDHIEREINPALQSGRWVVTDRYVLSSLAYQSIECDPGWVKSINRFAPAANLTVLIDIDVDVAMARIEDRGEDVERFESKSMLEKIRSNYLELAENLEGHFIKIDGALSEKEITDQIIEEIKPHLP